MALIRVGKKSSGGGTTELVLYERGTKNVPFTMNASPASKYGATELSDSIRLNYGATSSYGFKTTDLVDVSNYDTLKVYLAVNNDEQTTDCKFTVLVDLSRWSNMQIWIVYVGNTLQIQGSDIKDGNSRQLVGACGSKYSMFVNVYKVWLEKSS